MSRCEEPPANASPETDFRGFIDSILESNNTGRRVIENLESRFSSDKSLKATQEQSRRKYSSIIEDLLAERRDLNAHYGWVLASDAQLVYRSMGGTGEKGSVWARQWLRTVFADHEQVGRALENARLRLEI